MSNQVKMNFDNRYGKEDYFINDIKVGDTMRGYAIRNIFVGRDGVTYLEIDHRFGGTCTWSYSELLDFLMNNKH